MSTWISKGGASSAALFLSGCLLTGAPPAPEGAPTGVTVAAPRGFCIEQSDRPDPGFVLIGTCQGMRLAGIPLPPFTGRARHPAILTAAVGLPGTALPLAGAGEELTAFFRSADGRAALSRSGQARLVRVDEARLLDAERGGVFALWLTDDSPLPGGQATADYWRALMPVRDRMVTLTVTGLRERPVTREEGLELLTDFVAAIRRANPEPPPAAAPAPLPAVQADPPPPVRPRPRPGI